MRQCCDGEAFQRPGWVLTSTLCHPLLSCVRVSFYISELDFLFSRGLILRDHNTSHQSVPNHMVSAGGERVNCTLGGALCDCADHCSQHMLLLLSCAMRHSGALFAIVQHRFFLCSLFFFLSLKKTERKRKLFLDFCGTALRCDSRLGSGATMWCCSVRVEWCRLRL